MGGTRRIAGLMVAAGLVAGSISPARAEQLLTLEVLVIDEAGAPEDALREAQKETSRIFAVSGIHIVWVRDVLPRTRYVAIKVVSTAPSRHKYHPGVLGTAAGSKDASGTVAWLFFDRIKEQGHVSNLELPLLLGHVMAHEMGHLLLGYGSHSQTGLMKASWDPRQASLATAGVLNFASQQTALIRANLSTAAGMMASR